MLNWPVIVSVLFRFDQDKAEAKKGKPVKKPPLAVGGRNLDALNALAAATEQTLKVNIFSASGLLSSVAVNTLKHLGFFRT